MAKFVTFIADPELESLVIKEIANLDGELAVRGVSLEQVREAEKSKDMTLVCTRNIDFAYRRVIVDKSMSANDISALLMPENSAPKFEFNPNGAKVICFAGLSGGVGTTTIAINYAFEHSERSSVLLSDLDGKHPDIARALGVHRIDGRIEKLTKTLSVVQGLIHDSKFEEIVFDIGSNLFHPIIELATEINLVARVGFNTLARLSELDIQPTSLILNFSERSKAQQKWVEQIGDSFPRLKIIKVPLDSKNFESAAVSRSALMEVASNSLARKSIATLG